MAVIPFLKTLDITKASALLEKYTTDPNQDPVILMWKRKPLAILLPAQGGDVESISVSLSPVFHEIMRRSLESYYREGGISSEEIRREFGLPPYKEKAKRKSRKPRTTNRKRSTDGRQV